MVYLDREGLLLINRMTIDQHGGNFVPPSNILNENGLEYVIEAVKAEMFGEEMYPGVYDKAAVYMFSIISNHVFHDGNKRTGLESGLLFLKLNAYRLKSKLSKVKFGSQIIPAKGEIANEVLFHFTMELASGKIELEGCRKWFQKNVELI